MRAIARVVGGLAVAGIAYAGTAVTDDNTTRGDNGEITEAGGLGAMAVRVGDCINIPTNDGSSELIVSVEGIPCNEPHDEEAYFLFDATSARSYSALGAMADDRCYDEFEDYVGISWDESTLEFYSWLPNDAAWDAGDREITCLVYNPGGSKMLGSMKGTRR